MNIDLSLKNAVLYAGCEITEVGGRLTLTTPIQEATNIVGRNAAMLVDMAPQRDEIVLTGPMAVWSYLVVFHVALHKFGKIFYDDGRSGKVLIAQH